MKKSHSREKLRKPKGKLTVIAGPMFSGKTGKLVAMVEVLTKMGKKVLTVKPLLDARYGGKNEIHSHDHKITHALVLDGESPDTIVKRILSEKVDVVIFDEVQFFDREKIIKVIKDLKKLGLHVIAGGLMYDFRRQPFGATPDLLGLADERLELMSVCQKCGCLARHSERMKGGTGKIDVGASDKYIAACERCHRIYR